MKTKLVAVVLASWSMLAGAQLNSNSVTTAGDPVGQIIPLLRSTGGAARVGAPLGMAGGTNVAQILTNHEARVTALEAGGGVIGLPVSSWDGSVVWTVEGGTNRNSSVTGYVAGVVGPVNAVATGAAANASAAASTAATAYTAATSALTTAQTAATATGSVKRVGDTMTGNLQLGQSPFMFGGFRSYQIEMVGNGGPGPVTNYFFGDNNGVCVVEASNPGVGVRLLNSYNFSNYISGFYLTVSAFQGSTTNWAKYVPAPTGATAAASVGQWSTAPRSATDVWFYAVAPVAAGGSNRWGRTTLQINWVP